MIALIADYESWLATRRASGETEIRDLTCGGTGEFVVIGELALIPQREHGTNRVMIRHPWTAEQQAWLTDRGVSLIDEPPANWVSFSHPE